MFCPNRSHELALKRLAKYLKHTHDRGLVLDQNYDIFKVDVYPDTEVSGMCGQENPNDSTCAKSRNGFIITFSDFPVFWISKLQTETALYTM